MTTSRLATSRDLPVGDLLEPGRYEESALCLASDPKPPDNPAELVRAYKAIVPNLLGACARGAADDLGIIHVCLLPDGHDDWPDGTLSPIDGRRHRLYRCSPRDSAAMLAGMRRRLDA